MFEDDITPYVVSSHRIFVVSSPRTNLCAQQGHKTRR